MSKTLIKDLKKIISIQQRTLFAEKNVSNMLFDKLVRNDHLILNSDSIELYKNYILEKIKN